MNDFASEARKSMSTAMEVIETNTVVVAPQGANDFNTQIDIAKRYPRDLERAIKNSIFVVSHDRELAESCHYSVSRAGSEIKGVSVHLALILAQNYQNLRCEAKVREIKDRTVVSEAVCFDLENNFAVKVEVHRSILKRDGGRFSDDMITVTGNAANSIALRNAILKVIPRGLTDKVSQSAKETILHFISGDKEFEKERRRYFDRMKTAFGVSEKVILEYFGVNSIKDVTRENVLDLVSIGTALKDGDTTVKEIFGDITTEKSPSPGNEMKKIFDNKDLNNLPNGSDLTK